MPRSLAPAAANSPYSQNFAANGGSGSYAFSEIGSLPVGLSLSKSGLLAGTPETAGAYTFTVTATDNNNPSLVGTQTYTLNTALGFDLAPLPTGAAGVPYSQAVFITPVGGSGTYSFAETGALPSGMSFSASTGQLSGTPTQAGQFRFLVTATDTSSGLSASQSFTLAVGLAISPSSSLAAVPVGFPYTNAFAASGGNPGDTYFYSESGDLPPGLSLSSSGQLAGTPDQPGSYSFTVAAVDADNPAVAGRQSYTLNIGLQLLPGAMPSASVGQSYNQYLTATGGSGDYQFTITGNDPSWLVLSANGTQAQLQGTPPAGAGAYSFTVKATDANNPELTVSQTYTLVVNPLTVSGPMSLPYATVGVDYAPQYFSASGGTAPYSFQVVSWQNDQGQSGTGSFDGLSVAPTLGQLTGTPMQPGQYTFSVAAVDSSSPQNYGAQTFTLVVFAPSQAAPTSSGSLSLSPNSLPPGLAGSAYAAAITATGGAAGDAYSFSETGALPTGMSIQSTGLLTGTPTQPGTYNFTVVAADNNNPSLTGSRQYTLTIANNGLPATFTESSETAIASGSNGLSLPQGTIYVQSTSGFSPTGGTLSVAVTDSQGKATTTTVIYSGINGNSFIGCSGGKGTMATGGRVISLQQGLPTGTTVGDIVVASINGFPSSGTLVIQTTTGTAIETYAGTTPTAFTGCTGYGGTTATDFLVSLYSPASPVSLSPTILATGTVGSPYEGYNTSGTPTYRITATGGTGSYTYQVSGGALPPSISLSSATGLLTGTPIVAGTFAFSVSATDGAGNAGSQQYSITILPKPSSQSPSRYSPQQIRQAYGINNIILSGGIRGDGTGQTIAILADGDDPYLVSSTDPNFVNSDLHQFDVHFGLPDPPSFLKLDGYGGTNYPATGSVGETAQDVEWAHALAPGANIILFEGTGSLQTAPTALNYPGVTVISNSYAGTEKSTDSANDAIYLAPTGKNVTFVTAAGDNNPDGPPPPTVYPASSPYVLAAGMTALATDSQGNYVGEAGNAVSDWGGSQYHGQPAYQTGIVSAVSTTQRTSPDVSFVGETTYRNNSGTATLVGGKWTNANGTSLATPAWAALLAIADQGRALHGLAPLNGPTDTLPDLYSLPASDFNKITNLDNGSISQGNANYNQSGLGSPVANRLIPGLVGGHDTISGQVTAGGTQAGWTVFLSAAPNAVLTAQEASTTTDANGDYSFLVAPGTYYVNVVPPASWGLIDQTSGPIAFASGTDNVKAANFLFTAPASQIYVDNLYQLLLHRNPDPGAAAWINLLNAGTSPSTVVLDIEQSPEYLTDVVAAVYQHYLNRAPDPGAQYWVNQLENAVSIEQVIDGIVSSPEFFQDAGGTNAGFITALYQDILNRSPDPAGAAYWLDALAGGSSPSAVAMGFLTSSEHRNDLVNGYYTTYLRRTADPAGMAYWTAQLQGSLTDQQVLAAFLGSVEGFNKWS